MNRLPALLVVLLLSGILSSCGDDEEGGDAGAAQPTSEASASVTPAAVEGQLGRPATVRGQANVFGAGREQPPAPGGGGPGVPPPFWKLPDGPGRVVTFPSTAGRVNPIVGDVPDNGPGGDGVGPTDVLSYRGIAGIAHDRNGMFLTGVFLTDDPPAGPAPRRLDFTGRERFESLAPRVAQTFFIGDGKGRSYRVPASATRLFLGFADGYLYKGPPGWYGNNGGELSVTVEMASG